jgi:hypothetical protein
VIGTSQPGLEVFGVAGEDVDEAHVILLAQQAGPRRAHLEQLEVFPLPVSLGEVAEQLALVVGDEAVFDPAPAPTSLTEYHDHG